MNNREKLIKHLENLQKRGKREATVDIAWLLNVLETEPAPRKPAEDTPPRPQMPPNEIVLDGGQF